VNSLTNSPGCLLDTPQGAREYLAALEETNVDAVVFAVQSGDLAQDHILETIELFGSEVIPEFKGRQPHHELWRKTQLADSSHSVYSSL